MIQVDLIVTGGTVISMDAARRIIDRGTVVISGDRIVAVGDAEEIAARYTAPKTIDASGKVVMPGLIDVHAHAGHGLIKTMGMEQAGHWEEICNAAYTTGSTPEFWYAEARLAALERLHFGVTTGVSLLGGGDTIMRTDDTAYGRAHCEGVTDIGTRGIVNLTPDRHSCRKCCPQASPDQPTRAVPVASRQEMKAQSRATRYSPAERR